MFLKSRSSLLVFIILCWTIWNGLGSKRLLLVEILHLATPFWRPLAVVLLALSLTYTSGCRIKKNQILQKKKNVKRHKLRCTLIG
jgi:uncharacterized membrane protein